MKTAIRELLARHSGRVPFTVRGVTYWMSPEAAAAMQSYWQREHSKLRRSHCVHGHRLDGENIKEYFYISSKKRICVVCSRYRARMRREAEHGK